MTKTSRGELKFDTETQFDERGNPVLETLTNLDPKDQYDRKDSPRKKKWKYDELGRVVELRMKRGERAEKVVALWEYEGDDPLYTKYTDQYNSTVIIHNRVCSYR